MDVLVPHLTIYTSLFCALSCQLVLPVVTSMLIFYYILYWHLVVLPCILVLSVTHSRLAPACPWSLCGFSFEVSWSTSLYLELLFDLFIHLLSSVIFMLGLNHSLFMIHTGPWVCSFMTIGRINKNARSNLTPFPHQLLESTFSWCQIPGNKYRFLIPPPGHLNILVLLISNSKNNNVVYLITGL